MTRTVFDKHGTKYQLETSYDADTIWFKLHWSHNSYHQTIGTATITIQGPHHWLIEDICLDNESTFNHILMLFPERSFFQKIVDYLKGKPKARNFRDMGLGNVLLQSIVGEAREYGVRNIQGTVGHSDRLETPFLVQWCAKNGFREISRKPGHPRNAEVLMGINL